MSEKKTQTASGYKRTLSNAHIQLIALGGTIGTGLFLGVGDSIHRAGPSVILIYYCRYLPLPANAGTGRTNYVRLEQAHIY